ncbi:MAG: carbamoyl phosphate synthase small subunit [Clostridiales bacterium]|nr:carbamoyl phosphate synthase small subunit [Clostridiales bacterium]
MTYLTLANGAVFTGRRIGAPTGCSGELVFTTGMTGYQETLTDPSYAGQIVIQTFPMIGNVGTISKDFEGAPALRGYVVRELCTSPSNFRTEGPLQDFLVMHGISGIAGVDTRELVRILREEGAMNAAITEDAPADPATLVGNFTTGTVAAVSCRTPIVYPASGEKRFTVALMDYGMKKSIAAELCARGCEVIRLPQNTTAEEVLSLLPDGIMLSNGPGDPAENTSCIAEIRKLLGRVPLFGICLGHQLTALAAGGRTEKLKYGHRGANQPVRELSTGRVFITSQNHGYAVVPESLSGFGILSYENANDGSCEGADYPNLRAFTVQFHPEAHGGPRDTGFLFDRFLSMMEG